MPDSVDHARGWTLEEADVVELTPYAVELRYDFDFWPDRETAQEALEVAQNTGRYLREALGARDKESRITQGLSGSLTVH